MEAGYPHNFRVDCGVFKDDESKTEAKTNNGHRVCLLFVRSLLLACTEHVQIPLFVYHEQNLLLAHTFWGGGEKRCIMAKINRTYIENKVLNLF